MKRQATVSLSVLLFFCVAWAKKPEPKFNSIEVTHFTLQEGVELSPEFTDYLYASMRESFEKSGLFEQIVGEGEVAEPSEAGQALVVKGTILEFRKGSAKKRVLGGILLGSAGAALGQRSLRAQFAVHRRQGDQSVFEKELKVKSPIDFDPKRLANELAKQISKELKKGLKP